MSRVHDALRRAEQMLESGGLDALPPGNDARALTLTEEGRLAESGPSIFRTGTITQVA